MKQNDAPSAQQAGKTITMLNAHRKLTRPTAYDKAIAFRIADRVGEGENLEAILGEPGMPDQDTFFCWLEENPEASHHLRVKQQVREVLADQEKKKRQAKYGPRRWTELFPLIGPPPLLSTEKRAGLCRSARCVRRNAPAGRHHGANPSEGSRGCHLGKGAPHP
jgi:hypothetical protein